MSGYVRLGQVMLG